MSLDNIVQGRVKLNISQRQTSWEIQWKAVNYDLCYVFFYHHRECGILIQLAFSSPQQEGIRLSRASVQASAENTDVGISPSRVGKGWKDKQTVSESSDEHWQEGSLFREAPGFQRSGHIWENGNMGLLQGARFPDLQKIKKSNV